MKRGDLVTIAVAGDYGKPRPALVVQADVFGDLPSVTVLRLTSELHDWPVFRVSVAPDAGNGLRVANQIMLDKAVSLPRARVGAVIGRVGPEVMGAVSQGLAVFLGLDEEVRG